MKTFLELAEEIDFSKKVNQTLQEELDDAQAALIELKKQHAIEQNDAYIVVGDKQNAKAEAYGKLKGLYREMQGMMGSPAPAEDVYNPGPTTGELKQLFLQGQKVRGSMK